MQVKTPLPYSEATQKILEYARATIQQVAIHTPGEVIDSGTNRVLSLFSSVMLQHFQAIIILTDAMSTPASVMALSRPLIETFVRGHYLFNMPKEAERFFRLGNDFRFPKFREMTTALGEKTPVAELFSGFALDYGGLSDYTHTGSRQIFQHFRVGQSIGPPDWDEDARRILWNSTMLILANFVVLTQHLGNEQGSDALVKWGQDAPKPDQ